MPSPVVGGEQRGVGQTYQEFQPRAGVFPTMRLGPAPEGCGAAEVDEVVVVGGLVVVVLVAPLVVDAVVVVVVLLVGVVVLPAMHWW